MWFGKFREGKDTEEMEVKGVSIKLDVKDRYQGSS